MRFVFVLISSATLVSGCVTSGVERSTENIRTGRISSLAEPGGEILVPFSGFSNYKLGALYYNSRGSYSLSSGSTSIEILCDIIPEHNLGSIDVNVQKTYEDEKITLSDDNKVEIGATLKAIAASVSAKLVRKVEIDAKNIKYAGLNDPEARRVKNALVAGRVCKKYIADIKSKGVSYFQLVGVAFGDLKSTVEYEVGGSGKIGLTKVAGTPEFKPERSVKNKIEKAGTSLVFKVYKE